VSSIAVRASRPTQANRRARARARQRDAGRNAEGQCRKVSYIDDIGGEVEQTNTSNDPTIETLRQTLTEDQVRELLGLKCQPPAQACPRALKSLLRKRDDESKHLACRQPCKCWTCEVCFRRNQHARGLHFATVLAKHGGPFFVTPYTQDEWIAARQQIRRAKGLYLRVEQGFAPSIIISTVPVSAAPPLDPPAAIKALGKAVRTLGRRPGKGQGPATSRSQIRPAKLATLTFF
jgi:hypothetical protein